MKTFSYLSFVMLFILMAVLMAFGYLWKENGALRETLAEMAMELDGVMARCTQQKQQFLVEIQSRDEQIASAQQEAELLEQNIHELEQQKAQVQAKLDMWRAQTAIDMQNKDNRIAELEQKLGELTQALEATQQELDRIRSSCSLNRQSANAGGDVCELQTQPERCGEAAGSRCGNLNEVSSPSSVAAGNVVIPMAVGKGRKTWSLVVALGIISVGGLMLIVRFLRPQRGGQIQPQLAERSAVSGQPLLLRRIEPGSGQTARRANRHSDNSKR